MTKKLNLDTILPLPTNMCDMRLALLSEGIQIDKRMEIVIKREEEMRRIIRNEAFKYGLEEAAKLVQHRDPAHVGNVYAIRALKDEV